MGTFPFPILLMWYLERIASSCLFLISVRTMEFTASFPAMTGLLGNRRFPSFLVSQTNSHMPTVFVHCVVEARCILCPPDGALTPMVKDVEADEIEAIAGIEGEPHAALRPVRWWRRSHSPCIAENSVRKRRQENRSTLEWSHLRWVGPQRTGQVFALNVCGLYAVRSHKRIEWVGLL